MLEREVVTKNMSSSSQLKQIEEKNEEIFNFFNEDLMMGLRRQKQSPDQLKTSSKIASPVNASFLQSITKTINTHNTSNINNVTSQFVSKETGAAFSNKISIQQNFASIDHKTTQDENNKIKLVQI
jgi:hypothetical protein